MYIQHLFKNIDENDCNRVKKYEHNIRDGCKIVVEAKNEIYITDDTAK